MSSNDCNANAGDSNINGATPKTLSHSVSITSVADFTNNENDVNALGVQKKQEVRARAEVSIPSQPSKESINLASAESGARVLFASDDWFARAENLLLDAPPMFDPDAYCNEGKVMDGWESRRKRQAGHDWCLIHLPTGNVFQTNDDSHHPANGKLDVTRVDIDTAYFTGNHVPKISIEMCTVSPDALIKLVSELPNGIERLIFGGLQGTGLTPDQVKSAKHAVDEIIPSTSWTEVIPPTPLRPGNEDTRFHTFELNNCELALNAGNLVRVNYFPDGGVARLRLWAQPSPPPESVATDDDGSFASNSAVIPQRKPLYMPVVTGPTCTVVSHSSVPEGKESQLPSRQSTMVDEYTEISSLEQGGKGLSCSNKHYGEPWQLIQSSLGENMASGWETARHPDRPSVWNKDTATGLMDSPLKDWAILKLGYSVKPSENKGISRIILDTRHFRGNFPESVLLEGTHWDDNNGDETAIPPANDSWFPLISRTRMSPDAEHVFDASMNQIENIDRPVTHVRVSIFPDGGISRVRVFV